MTREEHLVVIGVALVLCVISGIIAYERQLHPVPACDHVLKAGESCTPRTTPTTPAGTNVTATTMPTISGVPTPDGAMTFVSATWNEPAYDFCNIETLKHKEKFI